MANFLQDDAGNQSSMRMVTVSWNFGILIAFCYVVFMSKALPDVPASVLAILGMMLTAKVGQKMVETKPCDTTQGGAQ